MSTPRLFWLVICLFGPSFTHAPIDDIVPRGMSNASVEALWRERVRQAELNYTQASATAARIQKEYAEQPHTSDDHFALQQALRIEEETRQEYMHVLHLLTRLLVAGGKRTVLAALIWRGQQIILDAGRP